MRYEVSWNWRVEGIRHGSFCAMGGSGFGFYRRIGDAKAAAESLAKEHADKEHCRIDIIDRWRGNELVFHNVKVISDIKK